MNECVLLCSILNILKVSGLSRTTSACSTICCLLSVSSSLSRDMQNVVSAPIASLVLFQIATAMLLIIGVLIDTHFLLVPFLLNSVLHICLAVGIAISVLFSSGDIKKLYGPHVGCFMHSLQESPFFNENSVVGSLLKMYKPKSRRFLFSDHNYLSGGASPIRMVHSCGNYDDNINSRQETTWRIFWKCYHIQASFSADSTALTLLIFFTLFLLLFF
ncbi:hypothetical protein NECAME_00544 [Necator americanus]|uniref:7TM GPCR serpentine receptor class x (Srx) domain-containing protein n=1 Tax=Necator americanus TaxID=51031 RepID=W2T527_NECAM|nr:hypothetical protein NECAME_00544 [Necator americanus]ETN77018.1 hypothetical protein NECAME_00544 [Necator americanus]